MLQYRKELVSGRVWATRVIQTRYTYWGKDGAEHMDVGRQETAANRKHILIVDDDPVELKTLRYYLQEKYKVTPVSSGKTAVDFLTKYTPDLILLDYLMPVHNGADVLKEIQSKVETKHIPVFFLTGQTDADTIRECLALHPAGYLVKPVAKTALLAKMEEVLG